MEKRMNRTWLFLLMLAIVIAAIAIWLWIGKPAGSYSGGILIELPHTAEQSVMTMGEHL